jgi:hypothetical protein
MADMLGHQCSELVKAGSGGDQNPPRSIAPAISA